MAINNPYVPGDPYSYDLKWIVEKTKMLVEEYTTMYADHETLKNDFNALYTYVHDYFDNLDLTEEVQEIIDNMVSDGSFASMIQSAITESGDVQQFVTDWLDANVNPVGSAVTVDNTLTIVGSAGDAAIIGGAIGGLAAHNVAFEVEGAAWILNGDNITKQVSTSWYATRFPCKKDVSCYVDLIDYGTNYTPIIIQNLDNETIFYDKFATSNTNVPYKGVITPSADGYIYICSRSQAPVVYTDLSYYRTIGYNNQKTKIATINCANFSHAVFDPDDWKKIINKMPADIINFCDAAGNPAYTQQITEGRYGNYNYSALGLYTYEQFNKAITARQLVLTSQVGTEINNVRNKALLTTFMLGNTLTAICLVHCAPSAGYENLRAAQYADIVTALANYDHAIVLGDFNAQDISEYAPFVSDGFTIANGDLIPVTPTIRDIPADNVLFKGVFADDVQFIDSEGMTDHYGMMVTITSN